MTKRAPAVALSNETILALSATSLLLIICSDNIFYVLSHSPDL